MCGHTAYDWKTMPRLRRFGGRKSRRRAEATTRSRRVISPSSGCSRPATSRRVVVLPQPLGPRRVKTSPRLMDRLTSSTALAVPKSLVTRSSERTVSVVPGSAPTLVPLLDDRLGDVLRPDDLGQVFLRVYLEELGATGHREGRIARLYTHAATVRLHLPRPHHLSVLGQEPVDEDPGRIGMRGAVDEPHRAAAGVHGVHLWEVIRLEVLAQALLLELAQEEGIDAEGDGVARAHHELRDLARVAAQCRLLVHEELLDDVVAQVETRARHGPEGVAHGPHVGEEQLALPARVEQVVEALDLFLDHVRVHGDACPAHGAEAVAQGAILHEGVAALEAAVPAAVFRGLGRHDGGPHGIPYSGGPEDLEG